MLKLITYQLVRTLRVKLARPKENDEGFIVIGKVDGVVVLKKLSELYKGLLNDLWGFTELLLCDFFAFFTERGAVQSYGHLEEKIALV